jgi:hypothetical protein
MSADVAKFLRARLLDDERAAEPIDEDGTRWLYDGIAATGKGWVLATSGTRIECPLPVARHIARQQPSRVMRDIEAKRRIVADFERAENVAEMEAEAGRPEESWAWESKAASLYGALMRLAAVYSDHPDYRQEWNR